MSSLNEQLDSLLSVTMEDERHPALAGALYSALLCVSVVSPEVVLNGSEDSESRPVIAKDIMPFVLSARETQARVDASVKDKSGRCRCLNISDGLPRVVAHFLDALSSQDAPAASKEGLGAGSMAQGELGTEATRGFSGAVRDSIVSGSARLHEVLSSLASDEDGGSQRGHLINMMDTISVVNSVMSCDGPLDAVLMSAAQYQGGEVEHDNHILTKLRGLGFESGSLVEQGTGEFGSYVPLQRCDRLMVASLVHDTDSMLPCILVANGLSDGLRQRGGVLRGQSVHSVDFVISQPMADTAMSLLFYDYVAALFEEDAAFVRRVTSLYCAAQRAIHAVVRRMKGVFVSLDQVVRRQYQAHIDCVSGLTDRLNKLTIDDRVAIDDRLRSAVKIVGDALGQSGALFDVSAVEKVVRDSWLARDLVLRIPEPVRPRSVEQMHPRVLRLPLLRTLMLRCSQLPSIVRNHRSFFRAMDPAEKAHALSMLSSSMVSGSTLMTCLVKFLREYWRVLPRDWRSLPARRTAAFLTLLCGHTAMSRRCRMVYGILDLGSAEMAALHPVKGNCGGQLDAESARAYVRSVHESVSGLAQGKLTQNRRASVAGMAHDEKKVDTDQQSQAAHGVQADRLRNALSDSVVDWRLLIVLLCELHIPEQGTLFESCRKIVKACVGGPPQMAPSRVGEVMYIPVLGQSERADTRMSKSTRVSTTDEDGPPSGGDDEGGADVQLAPPMSMMWAGVNEDAPQRRVISSTGSGPGAQDRAVVGGTTVDAQGAPGGGPSRRSALGRRNRRHRGDEGKGRRSRGKGARSPPPDGLLKMEGDDGVDPSSLSPVQAVEIQVDGHGSYSGSRSAAPPPGGRPPSDRGRRAVSTMEKYSTEGGDALLGTQGARTGSGEECAASVADDAVSTSSMRGLSAGERLMSSLMDVLPTKYTPLMWSELFGAGLGRESRDKSPWVITRSDFLHAFGWIDGKVRGAENDVSGRRGIRRRAASRSRVGKMNKFKRQKGDEPWYVYGPDDSEARLRASGIMDLLFDTFSCGRRRRMHGGVIATDSNAAIPIDAIGLMTALVACSSSDDVAGMVGAVIAGLSPVSRPGLSGVSSGGEVAITALELFAFTQHVYPDGLLLTLVGSSATTATAPLVNGVFGGGTVGTDGLLVVGRESGPPSVGGSLVSIPKSGEVENNSNALLTMQSGVWLESDISVIEHVMATVFSSADTSSWTHPRELRKLHNFMSAAVVNEVSTAAEGRASGFSEGIHAVTTGQTRADGNATRAKAATKGYSVSKGAVRAMPADGGVEASSLEESVEPQYPDFVGEMASGVAFGDFYANIVRVVVENFFASTVTASQGPSDDSASTSARENIAASSKGIPPRASPSSRDPSHRVGASQPAKPASRGLAARSRPRAHGGDRGQQYDTGNSSTASIISPRGPRSGERYSSAETGRSERRSGRDGKRNVSHDLSPVDSAGVGSALNKSVASDISDSLAMQQVGNTKWIDQFARFLRVLDGLPVLTVGRTASLRTGIERNARLLGAYVQSHISVERVGRLIVADSMSWLASARRVGHPLANMQLLLTCANVAVQRKLVKSVWKSVEAPNDEPALIEDDEALQQADRDAISKVEGSVDDHVSQNRVGARRVDDVHVLGGGSQHSATVPNVQHGLGHRSGSRVSAGVQEAGETSPAHGTKLPHFLDSDDGEVQLMSASRAFAPFGLMNIVIVFARALELAVVRSAAIAAVVKLDRMIEHGSKLVAGLSKGGVSSSSVAINMPTLIEPAVAPSGDDEIDRVPVAQGNRPPHRGSTGTREGPHRRGGLQKRPSVPGSSNPQGVPSSEAQARAVRRRSVFVRDSPMDDGENRPPRPADTGAHGEVQGASLAPGRDRCGSVLVVEEDENLEFGPFVERLLKNVCVVQECSLPWEQYVSPAVRARVHRRVCAVLQTMSTLFSARVAEAGTAAGASLGGVAMHGGAVSPGRGLGNVGTSNAPGAPLGNIDASGKGRGGGVKRGRNRAPGGSGGGGGGAQSAAGTPGLVGGAGNGAAGGHAARGGPSSAVVHSGLVPSDGGKDSSQVSPDSLAGKVSLGLGASGQVPDERPAVHQLAQPANRSRVVSAIFLGMLLPMSVSFVQSVSSINEQYKREQHAKSDGPCWRHETFESTFACADADYILQMMTIDHSDMAANPLRVGSAVDLRANPSHSSLPQAQRTPRSWGCSVFKAVLNFPLLEKLEVIVRGQATGSSSKASRLPSRMAGGDSASNLHDSAASLLQSGGGQPVAGVAVGGTVGVGGGGGSSGGGSSAVGAGAGGGHRQSVVASMRPSVQGWGAGGVSAAGPAAGSRRFAGQSEANTPSVADGAASGDAPGDYYSATVEGGNAANLGYAVLWLKLYALVSYACAREEVAAEAAAKVVTSLRSLPLWVLLRMPLSMRAVAASDPTLKAHLQALYSSRAGRWNEWVGRFVAEGRDVSVDHGDDRHGQNSRRGAAEEGAGGNMRQGHGA